MIRNIEMTHLSYKYIEYVDQQLKLANLQQKSSS